MIPASFASRPFIAFAMALGVSIAMFAVAGCDSGTEPAQRGPVGDAAAPPPPTPEELARTATRDLGLDAPLPLPGVRLPASERAAIIMQFEQQHATLSKTPEGQAALVIVKNRLDDRVRALYRAEMWEYVLVYSDAYNRLDPGSNKFAEMREKAEVELRKPRVTVLGLPQVNGHQMAMLSIYIPMSSQTFKETLSVGDEAHGVQFLGVYGENRGVRLEYLETGERYVALLKSAK